MLIQLDDRYFEQIADLLEISFPPQERRPRWEQQALLSQPDFQIYGLLGEDGQVQALLSLYELEDLIFLEHFAVDPACRNQGMGRQVLRELMEQMTKPVCLEAEPPETSMAKRRIAFYQRNGFFINAYPYIQPPMSHGQEAVPLVLMTYGGAVSQDTFEAYREAIYRRVYHLPDGHYPPG